jgi:hypothetical protein
LICKSNKLFKLAGHPFLAKVYYLYFINNPGFMKKAFMILAWLNGMVGLTLMLLGVIAVLAGDRFLGHFWSNYFYPAYNFILMGIFFFIAILVNKEKRD